mmetsp:Transcript_20760/g.39422  ORF Transcript_20760/g.39422 Transcript_20760/m.39422 type:complete len:882 (+) Transcript_20760:148-2793(+)
MWGTCIICYYSPIVYKMIFLCFLQLLVVTAVDAADQKAIRGPFLHEDEQVDVAKNKSREIQTLLERTISQNEVTEDDSCDPIEEEYCVDYNGQAWCASVADGGCPCGEDEVECFAVYYNSTYCAAQCCNDFLEETCFSNDTTFESCALIADGGCPCPEGEVKCGRLFFQSVYVGICAPICCDWSTEETCYSEVTWEPESCALISEGGCPCPEGQIKCGAFPGYAGYCTEVCCDDSIEETCYSNATWEAESCALISEGGCPCEDGEVKCEASLGFTGYCTDLCCNQPKEEMCYSEDVDYCALISDGGCPCPDGKVKCDNDQFYGYSGSCETVCCDETIEETCYSDVTDEAESCALIADGGCPCSDGEVKCGATEYDSGYCTYLCCDEEIEETCFSQESGFAESCALIENGGCPCPEGQVKCGASAGYAGSCMDVCCDSRSEEICHGDVQGQYCALIDDGGCPCPEGQFKCGATEGYAGYCASVCCNPSVEETCFNFDTWEPESCALIADGGCPCPYGQVKCGAFDGYAGFCSPVCCDDEIEETCHSTYSGRAESCALISEGGCTCPDGEVKCNSFGDDIAYCARICCDQLTEENCFSPITGEVESCALIADGGCPCPKGEVKCGATEGYSGHCAKVCCDALSEETCHGESGEFCALISEGGCPCPKSFKKCGRTDKAAGTLAYCASICCNEDQEHCVGFDGVEYCADYASGGCPCWPGEVKCGAHEDYSGHCTDICCKDGYESCMDFWGEIYCAPLSRGGCLMNEYFFQGAYISYGESSGGIVLSNPPTTSTLFHSSSKASKKPKIPVHLSSTKSSKAKSSGKSSKSLLGKSSKALSSKSVSTPLFSKSMKKVPPTGLLKHNKNEEHRIFRGNKLLEGKLFG